MVAEVPGLYADKVVGSYKYHIGESYYIPYDIMGQIFKNKIDRVYVQVPAVEAKKAFIVVENLTSFKASLEKLKKKYEEWVEIAKNNSVEKFEKKFDIKFPKLFTCWEGSLKWWYDTYYFRPEFKFVVEKKSGKIEYKAYWSVQNVARDNQYINEVLYLCFYNSDDIDNLIKALDMDALQQNVGEPKYKESDLFK